jgi:hypothetical protein
MPISPHLFPGPPLPTPYPLSPDDDCSYSVLLEKIITFFCVKSLEGLADTVVGTEAPRRVLGCSPTSELAARVMERVPEI